MGRMMPFECPHGVTIDWGDFGECQGHCEEVHPDDLYDCPDSPGPEACPDCMAAAPKWNQDEVQRVLYHVVDRYLEAAMLGGDDELLRSAIFQVAIPTLKDNGHWPEDDGRSIQEIADTYDEHLHLLATQRGEVIERNYPDPKQPWAVRYGHPMLLGAAVVMCLLVLLAWFQ